MPEQRMSRGHRNNNPGNIDRNAANKWQGSVLGTDSRFETFESMEYGIRALARVLISYKDKHDLKTIRHIINRWAPPHENNTTAYINAVAKACDRSPESPIDVYKYEDAFPLVKAIIHHENGYMPCTDEEITKGLLMAGIEKKGDPSPQACVSAV